jgi:hypothetical protein
MVEYLDIRTLSLISGIVAICCFATMLSVSIKRKSYPGFLEWTMAFLFNSIGLIMVALRDVLSEFFSIIVANSMIFLFFIYTTRGLVKFSGNHQRNWLDISALCSLIISFSIFTYISPNVNLRIIIISIAFFLFCCRNCYLIWFKLNSVFPKRKIFLFSAFIYVGGWFLLRTFLTFYLEGPIYDFMQTGFIQAFSFVNIVSSNVIISQLFLICNSERLEIDLITARNEVKTLTGMLPICSYCKKIRNVDGDWNQLEEYISKHSEALFSHGICPDCMNKLD